MVRQSLFLIVASIIVILCLHYVGVFLHVVHSFYAWLISILSHIIAGNNVANLIKQILALILIPLIIGLVIEGIYWVITKRESPYLHTLVWVIWTMLLTLLAVHKV